MKWGQESRRSRSLETVAGSFSKIKHSYIKIIFYFGILLPGFLPTAPCLVCQSPTIQGQFGVTLCIQQNDILGDWDTWVLAKWKRSTVSSKCPPRLIKKAQANLQVQVQFSSIKSQFKRKKERARPYLRHSTQITRTTGIWNLDPHW